MYKRNYTVYSMQKLKNKLTCIIQIKCHKTWSLSCFNFCQMQLYLFVLLLNTVSLHHAMYTCNYIYKNVCVFMYSIQICHTMTTYNVCITTCTFFALITFTVSFLFNFKVANHKKIALVWKWTMQLRLKRYSERRTLADLHCVRLSTGRLTVRKYSAIVATEYIWKQKGQFLSLSLILNHTQTQTHT